MNGFLQALKNLSPARLAAIAGIGIFLFGFIVFFINQLSSSDMTVLYSELDLNDSRQIVNKLDASGIKYKIRNNGTEILVPQSSVNKIKVDMSELNLTSKTGAVGYEIFDDVDALGSTNFMQNVNLLRALEGELARTIKSVDNIKNARVHIVMPKREMFSREEQTPKASVIIKTQYGNINPKEVMSIQKLVSASVPKLEPKNVSIIDSSGKLLTKNFSDDDEMQIASQEELRRNYEQKLENNIQELLERSIGSGKVRAQVSLEMDFDQVVTNEETYDPDGQVIRSTVTVEEESNSNESENGAVSITENLPESEMGNTGAVAQNNNSRTEETVNYEITKKVVNKVKNSGEIKRISAAVMVDGTYSKDTEGAETYTARSVEEMELLESLVKSAIGYNVDRGDLVEVANMKFISLEDQFEVEDNLIMGFTRQEIMKMVEGLGVAIVAVLVILLVIRPLISKAFDTSPQIGSDGKVLIGADGNNLLTAEIDEDIEFDELIDISKVEGRVKSSSVKKIGEIVEKHPEEALSIIRNWLYQDNQ